MVLTANIGEVVSVEVVGDRWTKQPARLVGPQQRSRSQDTATAAKRQTEPTHRSKDQDCEDIGPKLVLRPSAARNEDAGPIEPSLVSLDQGCHKQSRIKCQSLFAQRSEARANLS